MTLPCRRERSTVSLIIVLFLLSLAPGTGRAGDDIFTIGVLNSVPALSPAFEGFKAGMAHLDLIEGKDIEYIYRGLLENDNEVIDAEIRYLLAQDVDLFLIIGNEAAIRAKLAVEGTDLPILISGCNKPVESGLIESLIHPGGNITGVAGLPRTHKTLEWMGMAIPGLKKVYVPYNPDDAVSVISLPELEDGAAQLGIELFLGKVGSVKEAAAAIHDLPADVQAVFLIHSPTLNPGCTELVHEAIARGLPTGASLALGDLPMITYTTDAYAIGKKAARLAYQIYRGAKPGDLPFETADASLIINLQTAKKLHLEIPGSILTLAREIIR